MASIFFVQVRRCQIASTSKPPCGNLFGLWVDCFKVSIVQVSGWGVWVMWVDHHGQTAGEETHRTVGASLQILVICSHSRYSSRRQGAVHNRNVDTTFLESSSFLQNHRSTSAAVLTSGPAVSVKRFGVQCSKAVGDFLLFQSDQGLHTLADRARGVVDVSHVVGKLLAR
ncbi:hypothetical protein CLUG_04598 [Clavispora lusitaniae ATCC 42720]|uniref:Uncharacterized protein n=1 Tax=Clavispora lusitaniae (strain ATCC 42720) TaxID=306902 RepID=C4Y8S0_CLAL4|nr:uncharacterized protein CLUG_04598 [Clavispora lusitaniae ATCC 42720]EEQ40469.1 hypothetical protein CLUG_04598 [Clavispora lusitaniae ATCC 42720]